MTSLPLCLSSDAFLVLFLIRDNFGFITYRYTCDAFAALENGHTLRRSDEPQFELCFGGQKQFCKSDYTDLGEFASSDLVSRSARLRLGRRRFFLLGR